MKERGILFSGAMVRALLDGRKTQTRRVVKCTPAFGDPIGWETGPSPKIVGDIARFCPYGIPGDRLWVRETWAAWRQMGGATWTVRYEADGKYDDRHDVSAYYCAPRNLRRDRSTNAPSIFMPRWASRISLEITEVRVERVQAISEADAIAEGVPLVPHLSTDYRHDASSVPGEPDGSGGTPYLNAPKRGDFATLWNLINAQRGYGWDVNPWVWALAFKVLPS